MQPDPELLIEAAKEGKLELIMQYVNSGADIDEVDFPAGTALSAAASENQIDAAKLLIELGADLEKTDDSPMPMTALFHAVSNGHEDMARLLLEHKAEPNAMFLTWASTPRNCLEFLKNQNLENTAIYKLLVDYGAKHPTYIDMVEKYPEKTSYIVEAVVSAEHFDDAVELTNYLIGKQPNSTLFYHRGVAFDMKGNHDAALFDFDAAINLDSSNFQALYSRSLVLQKLGRWKESLADLESAIALNPSDYIVSNALASALLRISDKSMRDPARAVELANEACNLSDWNDEICIQTLAEAFLANGNKSKAKEMKQKFSDLRDRDSFM